MNIPKSSLPRIVIIGGGFAGIAIAKKLKNKAVQVVLIDKHNYHTFQPLLYQVATGGLEAGSIAYPLRKVVQEFENFYFRLCNVNSIDTKKNTITSDIGELKYDYLILATGSKTNFFGNKELEQNCMAMKTIPQSLNIRSLILENLEQALLITNAKERHILINFCIVGGGPTGVELAGALAEMKIAILQKDYPDLDINKMQINLIHSGDRILNTMSTQASKRAEKFLTKLGVVLYKNCRVVSYDGRSIITDSSIVFETATVIWTAGVRGAAIAGFSPTSFINSTSRLKVNSFNQVEGFDQVFAVGDSACMVNQQYPNGHPMVAQVAIQQGQLVAKNIIKKIKSLPMKPFVYENKGTMATIGRNKAVVDLPNCHFSGFIAWLVWIFVHLFSLVGFKNKVIVLLNWIYYYIRFDREERLIIRPFKEKKFTAFTSDEI